MAFSVTGASAPTTKPPQGINVGEPHPQDSQHGPFSVWAGRAAEHSTNAAIETTAAGLGIGLGVAGAAKLGFNPPMRNFATDPRKLGPAVVASVFGTVVADAAAAAVPDLMGKIKLETSTAQDKTAVKVKRAAVASVGTAVVAAGVFWKFPGLFQKTGLIADGGAKKWLADYGLKVVPVTVTPAASAAWVHPDTYDALGKVVDPKARR